MGRSFESRVLAPHASLFAGIGGVVALFGACMSDPAGISSDDAGGGQHGHTGGASTGGAGQSGSAGSDDHGGAGSDAAGNGGENTGTGGSGASNTGGNDTGGNENGGTSGSGGANSTGGMGGDDSNGGSAGSDAGAGGSDDGTVESCVFHSAPVPNAAGTGGAGGMAGAGGGGAGGASSDVTIRTSPFVGSYLADAAGRTLYFYGSDLTGDCSNPPVSRCTADCPATWPPFNAGARALPPELDDAAFGTIQRSDGTYQTTYYGWPLYYYKDDVAPASLAGQGKAKTWHVAEVKLPSVVIMREGTTRYLADTAGHTLYVSSADQVGNDMLEPESRCTGSCLMTFKPFSARNLAVVQSLEQDDFWSFVNPDGSLQLGYKGAPLYRARNDHKAGDMTGTATAGFTAAVP
jgi:predicted lipoprotein with Yx(FWY)xxD motif